MGLFEKKGISVSANFDYHAQAPLDSRTVVEDLQELNSLLTEKASYEGMKVYCKADKKFYTCTGYSWAADEQANASDLESHINNKNNPHEVTPTQIGAAEKTHTHTKSQIEDFPTSMKNPNALTISLNGASQGDYDGSISSKIDITASKIGAVSKSGSITSERVAIFSDNSGNIKDSGYTIESSVPADAKFTDTIYTHPSTHEATMIIQDETHRFVTDVEKEEWNSKEDSFIKNTAFNKNFGTVKGTVCEGDDERLYDAREAAGGVAARLGYTINISDFNTFDPSLISAISEQGILAPIKAVENANAPWTEASSGFLLNTNGSCYSLAVFNSSLNKLSYRSWNNGSWGEWNNSSSFDGDYNSLSNKPTSFYANMIVEDSTHRFTTDDEKAKWNDHVDDRNNPHDVTAAQVGAIAKSGDVIVNNVPVFNDTDGNIKDSGLTLGKSVPSDAKFTDTTYENMKGATSSSAGTAGLVPAPASGNSDRYLRSDGTWVVPPNTTYSVANDKVNGLMSKDMVVKLNTIEEGAQVNQNSFSNVKVGDTTIASDTTTDTLELIAGSNVTITPDADNDSITITSKDTIYTHPSTHPASMITEDSTHRFTTDTEKSKWNNHVSNTSNPHNVTAAQIGAALEDHTHTSDDIASIDASKITGTINIDNLPASVIERMVRVSNDTARFALTTSNVQNGDTVKVSDTGLLYMVIDDTKLNSENGYEVFTAGGASSVPWSGITGKPSVYPPESHTHSYAGSSTSGGAATKAINDNNGNKIDSTYIKSLSASGKTITYTKGDDTTGTITTQDTTYSNMKGATTSAAGTAGLVPAPSAGNSDRYLRSDGTWVVPPNTTYSTATTSTSGLMSAAMVTKLNGIATGAEVNQNSFSNIKVGDTTVEADTTTDTLELVAGSNVTITPDATNDKITITSKDTIYTHPSTHAATMITEDSTHRFVTDTEKSKWDNHVSSTSNPHSVTAAQVGAIAKSGTVAVGNVAIFNDTNGNVKDSGFTLGTSVPVGAKFTDTTYSNMKGATTTAAGTAGLVPAPASGNSDRYLRSDGTWVVPPNTTYSAATTSTSGLMTSSMVNKLNGIATGAEVNQNAFSNITVGSTTIAADSKTDTLELIGSGYVSLTPDDTNDKVTIDVSIPSATTGVNGLMTPTMVTKLNGISASAEVNQNAFSNVIVGSTTIAADSKTDTLTLTAGSNVTITPDADNDKITISAKDTTYSNMKGATTNAAGKAGLVPAPEAGNSTRYLRSDGTWVVPPDTTYSTATTSTAGLMSKDMVVKLNNIEESANNYTLPVATSSALGGVKSGTDITIDSSGNVSVNDNSHAHTITNVTGLQTALDGKAASSHTHSSYVNQNAFSNVLVGDTTIASDTTTDTLELVAGSNVTITPDANNDKITITAKDTTYSNMKGATSSAAGTAGLVPAPASGNSDRYLRSDGTWVVPPNTTYSAATTSTSGLMTSAMVNKLNGIATGAEVNQNAYSSVKVGSTTITSTSKTGVIELVAGSNVTLTPDADNDSITITSKDTIYTHPSTHAATMITEDSTHRFTTDTEKNKWNSHVSNTSNPHNVTAAQVGAALASHTHSSADITSIDASKITGTINIDNLPPAAIERLVRVTDDTARFALTKSNIQNGDTVKVESTGLLYMVVDDTKLNSEDGYEVFTAGGASSVPWTGVTGKPSTYPPSTHTHNYAGSSSAGGAATKAINDNNGNKIDSTYIKSLSVSGKTITYTKGNDTTGTITTQDTTYSNMKGATTSAAGTAGLVPAPSAGNSDRYLRSDGTWVVPPNTTYSAATTSTSGLMTAAMVTKLNGITEGANKYTLPVATSSALGGVKSGTDITVDSSGNVSVNDNSHAHTIANVTGLQTALNSKADSSHTHSSYVNQNAFSNITVGSTTVAADTTTDTLTLVAGSNVTITADATNDKITISAKDTTYTEITNDEIDEIFNAVFN